MPIFKFILSCETASTLVSLEACDRFRAYVAITVWMHSKPADLEEIKYNCAQLFTEGRSLIYISPAVEILKKD